MQPKKAAEYIAADLDAWKSRGVLGHFTGDRPWLTIDEVRIVVVGPSLHCAYRSVDFKLVTPLMTKVVGGEAGEVAVMNSLSTNLHLMMVAFYRPTLTRHKLLIEKGSFPSDWV